MTGVQSALLSLLVGALAGVLARRWRLPGGPIIAALVAVGLLHSLVDGLEPLDPAFRTVAQVAIGAVLGTSIAVRPLKALRAVAVPAGVVVLVLVAVALAVTFTVHAVTGLSLTTALFAFAPGGASDMTAAALQVDGDVGLVAAIHVVRQVTVFVLLVALFRRFLPPADPAGDDSRGDP